MSAQLPLQALKSAIRGSVIEPQDSEYEQARRVYNGMIDRHPRLIVRCSDVADVMAAVRFGRENGLLMAVRGGGHNGAGLAVCDDGLVIDLSAMQGIRVDPTARTVRAEGGCTLGEVDHASHAFGLAVPGGIFSTTGIAGLTLGGGHGYLTRKYGLTIDNLLQADVVLADGRLVTASEKEHEDLFWALRGGGGNFGIVTSFLFQAHPVSTVFAGPMLWEPEHTREVMQWYRDFLPSASEDLYGFFALMTIPGPPFPPPLHGRTMCGIVWSYTGLMERAEQAFGPVRAIRPPAFEHLGAVPYPALQSLFDPLLPPGLQWYWKGDFFTSLEDGAIEQHANFGTHLPTPLSTMHLYPIDGAPNRVDRHETAFSYREAKWSMVIAGIHPTPDKNDRMREWARRYWDALRPYSAGGGYVNFMMEEGADRVQGTYRDNYGRLAAVKAVYDPGNVFRVNQNIKPQG